MGFFQDLFGGTQEKAAREGAARQVKGYQLGQDYATEQFQLGRDDISKGYGRALEGWSPIAGLGRAGAGLYGDVTGVGGREGQERARQLYMTSPGYQFAVDEALRATERTRGTGGFQNSGNVLAALTDRASGLALQDFNNWTSRLAPFLQYSISGATGAGGASTAEADALNASRLAQGQLGYGSEVGQGGAEAAGIIGAAKAKAEGAQQIAKLAAQIGGALLSGGLSGGLGSLGSLGSSLGGNLLGSVFGGNAAAGFGNAFPMVGGGGYYQGGDLVPGPGYLR